LIESCAPLGTLFLNGRSREFTAVLIYLLNYHDLKAVPLILKEKLGYRSSLGYGLSHAGWSAFLSSDAERLVYVVWE
jgi:hypothetical protein